MLELFGYSTEELAKNSLLNVLVLPNAWCKGVNEQIVNVFLCSEIFELFDLLFSEGLMIFIQGSVANCLLSVLFLHLCVLLLFLLEATLFLSVSSLVSLDVGDNVDVGSVDILKCSSGRVDPDAHSLVNPCNLDPVTWLDIVYEVLIGTKMYRLGCFSLWYALWGFLNFHVLLIREHALVEDHLEGVSLVAILAECWFLNAAVLGDPLLFTVALDALELRFLHLGHNVAVADDYTSEGHQLVDVIWAELSDPVYFPEVVGPDLDNLVEFGVFIHELILHRLVALAQCVDVEAKIPVGLRDHQIKDRNHICWVVDNLAVQALVILVNVIAVHLQDILVKLSNLLKL